ncbi:hypothetical protein Ac2012v2_005655 [Leucoagaricus gongylophorus]
MDTTRRGGRERRYFEELILKRLQITPPRQSYSPSPVLIVPSRQISTPPPRSKNLQSFRVSSSSVFIEKSRHCSTPEQLPLSLSPEAEELAKLLQSMYNDIFRNMPDPEGDFTCVVLFRSTFNSRLIQLL